MAKLLVNTVMLKFSYNSTTGNIVCESAYAVTSDDFGVESFPRSFNIITTPEQETILKNFAINTAIPQIKAHEGIA